MIHPIFKAALQRPDLLVQHLSNHLALMKAEAKVTGVSWAMKAAAALLAGFLLLLALGLTGVAVMLGFMDGFHKALVIVPAVAWVASLLSLAFAMHRSAAAEAKKEVINEIEADLVALRSVKGEEHERERILASSADATGALPGRTAGAHGLPQGQ